MGEGRPPTGARFLDWQYYYETEKRVREKQDQLIAAMKEDEILILYPIYQTQEPMRRLEEFAQETLGDRCIVLRTEAPGPRSRGWIGCLSDEIRQELAEEIIEACIECGYEWSAQALKVAYTQRAYALEIEAALRQRGFTFDNSSVECEAFGESFEGCSMTWKSMLPHYLGLEKPIENDYELSVSDAPVLFNARFVERLALGGDVRLFLWEGAEGRPIALFARAWARLKDRQLFACLNLEGMQFQARDVSHRQWWPPLEVDMPCQIVEDDVLKVPVYAATRKTPLDKSYYLIGENVSFEAFRQRLIGATIRQ